MAERIYRVGTFFHNEGRRSFVTAYLRDYNPAWAGCIEYDIRAKSGAEAKKIASRRRLASARALLPPHPAKSK